MIAIDTSAIVALLTLEPDAERFAQAMAGNPCCMSSLSLLEAGMVLLGRHGEAGAEILDALVERVGIEVVPFDRGQAELARDAFRRFGKGRHPAALNLGDCAAYALAVARGVPLLFKGDDFQRTDVRAVFQSLPG